MSFYGAVIILVILILRAFTLHKLPKRAFLILWAVALVRLLVPFEISSGLSLYSLLPEAPGEFPLFTEQEPYIPDPANPYEPFENYADYLKNQGNTPITDEDVIIAEPDSGTIYLPVDNADVDAIPLPIDNADVDAIPLPDTETDANYTEGTSGQEPSDANTVPYNDNNTINRLQSLWSSLVPLLPILWAVGASLCAVFFLICYLKCLREFRTALPVTEDYAAEWLSRHPLKRKITVRQSDKISAPLTYGMLRPVILLPKKTDWTNRTQLDYVLYHEFTHIRRFDLLAKLVMIAALCLHWFNPFVWAMYVFFNRDLELSCDDLVVKHFGETKSDYAKTLIGMEERKNYGTPLCNHFSKNAIEERITAIMKSKKTTIGMIIAAVVIILLVVITLTTGRKDEDISTGVTPSPTGSITPVPTATDDAPTPTGTATTPKPTDTGAKPTPPPGQDFYYPEMNYTYSDKDSYARFEHSKSTVSPTDGYDFTISSF
ncbi:MAG: M56 family metallopeptidase, partial [Lachnospiraceae bacterium]|nr:M56 family metallopeptidase [Lachnospiraceae bacterium]